MITRKSALILIALFVSALNSDARMSSIASPQPVRPNVIMPKQLESPTVDGRCGDRSYLEAGNVTLSDTLGRPGARVVMFHSSRNAYLCVSGLPLPTNQRISIRINSDHGRSGTVTAADYEFFVTGDGSSGALRGNGRGNRSGTFVTFPLSPEDFTSAVARSEGQMWSAEMRISLEWFGGYARTDGLSIALEQSNGGMLQQWPRAATRLSPASWGDLALGPLYPETIHSGSAFLDGRNGYLVIPFAPELNPREITIEAWVRAPEGECGTLVGNGQRASYWLGLCGEVRFTHGGASSVFSGVHKLGDGWHHVAVTMNADGLRTFYVDGLVDRTPGWTPPHETRKGIREPSAVLGISDRMLRIGSDRDASEAEKSLHGYVRELRIWNRVRTFREIRADAFRSLTGKESGLVALWPFTAGLQELVAGRNAGLIGDASLARETPVATAFAPLPAPGTPRRPAQPRQVPGWDAVIPLSAKRIRLDGVCSAAEYERAAKVKLEPDRTVSLNLLELPDALVVCTNPLFGQHERREGITLWISRDGRPRSLPGPQDLRVHLAPDGSLTINAGDGNSFNGHAPSGIESKTISGARFSTQDDIRTLDAPWFSSEIRIPLEALRPFAPDDRLHFAVEYLGTVPAAVGPRPAQAVQIHEQWPAEFDPQRPATWGLATTRRDSGARPRDENLPLEIASNDPSVLNNLLVGRASDTAARTIVARSPMRPPFGPGASPTSQDFAVICPEPNLDMDLADKAAAYLKYASYSAVIESKWPLVEPGGREAVQVEGKMLTSHFDISAPVSAEDSPVLHDSNDVDMKINVNPGFEEFVLDGQLPDKRTLVIETESAGFPAHLASNIAGTPYTIPVRPGKDDHVTVVGNWVYDCGHADNAKTEIHPVYMFESDRVEFLPMLQQKPLQLVQVVRVWMNSDPGARSAFLGTFNFSVNLAPGLVGPKYLVRIKEGDAKFVSAQVSGTKMNFSVEPPQPTGQFYFEFVIAGGGLANKTATRMYEVKTHSGFITINNDHDSGVALGNGEWFLAAAVNGRWQQIFWNDELAEGPVKLDPIRQHRFFTTEPDLVWEVTAFEDDALDDDPGTDEQLSSGRFSQGSLAGLASLISLFDPNDPTSPKFVGGKHILSTPDWSMIYIVGDVTDMVENDPPEKLTPEIRPFLTDTQFWLDRLKEESNDTPVRATPLGTFDVPETGQVSTSHAGFITESSFENGAVRILGRDVDWYSIDFSDFAEVNVGGLPPELGFEVIPTLPNYPEVPKDLTDQLAKLGKNLLIGARIKVFSKTENAGDTQYALKITRSLLTLPPDSGEKDDDTPHKRQVDLTKVPPTEVTAATKATSEKRYREMDWAWQHVRGDKDFYQVILPSSTKPPFPPSFCEFNRGPKLVLEAPGMVLRIPALALEGQGSITMDLDGTPKGPIEVEVSGPNPNSRAIYRFTATWTNAKFYSPQECKLLRGVERGKKAFFGYAVEKQSDPWIFSGRLSGKGPNLPDPPPDSERFTLQDSIGYKTLLLEDGQVVDAIVSSNSTRPIIARLYDADGVLLGESQALGARGSGGARISGGLAPQSRLRVEGLKGGTFYYLQFVPEGERKLDSGLTDVVVGVSLARP